MSAYLTAEAQDVIRNNLQANSDIAALNLRK